MADIISCPSGLTGRIRGMRVREERVLADRKLAKSGGQVDELLSACWEEMQEAGPYAFADGKVDWGQVLQGDRFYALLQVRVLTYGPEYAFAVPCQSAACRGRIAWELNLTQLPVRAVSNTSRAAFMAGKRFETTLPDAGKRGRRPRNLALEDAKAAGVRLKATLVEHVSNVQGGVRAIHHESAEEASCATAEGVLGQVAHLAASVLPAHRGHHRDSPRLEIPAGELNRREGILTAPVFIR